MEGTREHHPVAERARRDLARTGGKRVFARHFGEMVLAMVAGMVVLGGLMELALGLSDRPGAVQIALMGVNMTVPMVLWMGYRGHARARSAEMATAMAVPTLAGAVVVWAGALGTAAGLGVQHAAMIPAMLGVMLWRYEHYSQRHARE